jgi:hypothetical protein
MSLKYFTARNLNSCKRNPSNLMDDFMQVAKLNADLVKCADDDTERIVDILKLLRTQAVTHAILKNTKVGKTVGSSR